MKLSVQAIIGLIVGCIIALFGVGLLTPDSTISENQMTPVLAAILTALGVAIIGASVLSGTSNVSGKSDKFFGLGIEASGGIGLFIITLIFISSFGINSDKGDKPQKRDKPQKVISDDVLFNYVTHCDYCCAQHYPNLAVNQCPIQGRGQSFDENEAKNLAVNQCQFNGGLYDRCQVNLIKVN